MIKGIIFDFGGVLTTERIITIFSRKIEELYNLNPKEVEEAFNKYVHPFEVNKITTEDFWDNFCKEIGIKCSSEELNTILNDSIVMNPDILDLVKQLKGKYKLACLSNDLPNIRNKMLSYLSDFEITIFSSEKRVRKPDKEIYDIVLGRLELKPEECVFIDDKQKNIDGANNLNIKGILFNGIEDLIKKLNL